MFQGTRDELTPGVESKDGWAPISPTWREWLFLDPAGARDLACFCNGLAVYLDAGFDLREALEYLEPTYHGSRLGRAIGRILVALRGGDTLSAAVARERGFRGRLLRRIADAEAQGKLQGVLRAYVRKMRLREARDSRVALAVMHPLFVLSVAVTPVAAWLFLRLPVAWIVYAAFTGQVALPRLVRFALVSREFLPWGRAWVLCATVEPYVGLMLLFAFLVAVLPYAARGIAPVVDHCGRILFGDDAPLRGAELIADFDQIRSAGDLTDEEFRRVCQLMRRDVFDGP
jgi:type II secretory pathway component PulF